MLFETWEEGEKKQALINQIRHACAAQQQHATASKGKPQAEAPFLDKDTISHILTTGREHAVPTDQTLQALIIEHPYSACKLPLHALDHSLKLHDLCLETRHTGRALIARRFGPVVSSAVGGTFGIEDEVGNTELLLVDAFSFAGDDVIPPDAVIAIKEPNCKVDANGKPRIKLSHPSDLVVLDPSDGVVPGCWRVDGLVVSEATISGGRSGRTHTCVAPLETGCEAVEVRMTGNAGRGLFAKHEIKFGEQILAEAALFLVSPGEENTFRALKYDLGKNMMTEDHLGAPHKELAREILADPSLAAKVFRLHSGTVDAPCDAETLVDGKPVVDIFHVHEVWAKNAIACPAQYDEKKAFPNRVSPDGDTASGLWYLTSYCNHFCLPNTEKSVKNGILTLRAMRDIQADEEIFISYGEYAVHAEKQHALRRIWGFTCECGLCEMEARTPKDLLTRREEIRSRIAAPLPDPLTQAAVVEAKSLLIEMRATYPDTDGTQGENEEHKSTPLPVPRTGLAEAHSRLFAIHSKLLNLDDAEHALLEMLKAQSILAIHEGEVVPLGGTLDGATVVNVLLLKELLEKARQEDVARKLGEFAEKVYEVVDGDLGGFENVRLPE